MNELSNGIVTCFAGRADQRRSPRQYARRAALCAVHWEATQLCSALLGRLEGWATGELCRWAVGLAWLVESSPEPLFALAPQMQQLLATAASHAVSCAESQSFA